MASGTKPRTVHYRRAQISDNSITLQNVLTAALTSKVKLAHERLESFTEDEHTFRLINRHSVFSGVLFGQFIAYEENKKQPTVALDETKEFFPLKTSDPGKDNAFADDIFYFGVRENDLVCAQTRSLRFSDFETHLAWILTTCTNLVKPNETIILSDQPPSEVRRKVSKTSAKSIKIGTQILSEEISKTPSKTGSKVQKKKFRLSGLGADIIKSIIGSNKFNKLDFKDDLDEANLELNVELKFLRKTTGEGQKAIDSLATSFRNIDGSDYELRLANGGVIKGSEMKVFGKVSVKHLSNGLIDENDLYKQMHDWLITNLIDEVSN